MFLPVLNEFQDVLPQDLQGIPQIEFGIDLGSITKPIYIPPNRMGSAEIKELKLHLKDLLFRGCI